MARIPEIERRLLNWARWRAGAGDVSFARADYSERVDGEGWDAPTVIPTSHAEAAETDKAVMSLERDQVEAVAAVYLGTRSVAERARKMGVSLATLYARVDQAHRALDRWFRDLKASGDAERERVEALQRAAVVHAAATPLPRTPVRDFGSRIAAWLTKRRAGGFTE